MATFEYRCPEDGVVDIRSPIGMAPARVSCPLCGMDTSRVFSVPMIAFGPRALVAAIDRTEQTRDEPGVVSALPSRGAGTRTAVTGRNPALQRLPRP